MSEQVDLFLDSIVDAPVKDDQALMAYPFFALAKKPRMEPIIYDDGKVRVEVRPGERGIATIWDKDILIYLVSVINDAIEIADALEMDREWFIEMVMRQRFPIVAAILFDKKKTRAAA